MPVDLDVEALEDGARVLGDGVEVVRREREDRRARAGEADAEQAWVCRGCNRGGDLWQAGDLHRRDNAKKKEGGGLADQTRRPMAR